MTPSSPLFEILARALEQHPKLSVITEFPGMRETLFRMLANGVAPREVVLARAIIRDHTNTQAAGRRAMWVFVCPTEHVHLWKAAHLVSAYYLLCQPDFTPSSPS